MEEREAAREVAFSASPATVRFDEEDEEDEDDESPMSMPAIRTNEDRGTVIVMPCDGYQ